MFCILYVGGDLIETTIGESDGGRRFLENLLQAKRFAFIKARSQSIVLLGVLQEGYLIEFWR